MVLLSISPCAPRWSLIMVFDTPIIWGMLASLVDFVGVSLLSPKPSEERMRTWERWLTREETTQVSREA
jgi:hypothetical protein